MRTGLKNILKSTRQVTLGSWISIGNAATAEVLCKAGFDWMVVDLEHTGIDEGRCEELIRTIDLCQVFPLVRLSSNDENQIKRVMDLGAGGVLVPMIKTIEDVKKAYLAMHYPPTGTRGVGLNRAQGFGVTFDAYQQWLRSESVLIAQIEHVDAVANLEAILDLDLLDGIILGPYDLSASLGKPGEFTDPKFQEIISQVRDVCKKRGVCMGQHIVEPDLGKLERAIQSGDRFIAYSVDFRMIDVASRSALSLVGKVTK